MPTSIPQRGPQRNFGWRSILRFTIRSEGRVDRWLALGFRSLEYRRIDWLILLAIYSITVCSMALAAAQCVSAAPQDPPIAPIASVVTPPPTNTTSMQSCPSRFDGPTEIWELSTRHLPDHFSCIDVNNPRFDVHRFDSGCWLKDDVENAVRSDDSIPLTIVYVHGNFMERSNARERVRIIDQHLRSRAQHSYRLIMLSWPSQQESKPLREVRDHAEAAERQSLYFAWILDRLKGQQVSILGFSYGARAITGGLHLRAGGHIPGLHYTPISPPGLESVYDHYHVGLVGPAIDRNWLTACGRHARAMEHVDALVNLYNSRDPILRRFRFVDRITRPVAAGFAGFIGIDRFSDPRSTTPLSSGKQIQQYDCGSIIGTTHSERSYYGNCPYFSKVIDNVLWNDIGSAPLQTQSQWTSPTILDKTAQESSLVYLDEPSRPVSIDDRDSVSEDASDVR